MKKDYKDFQKEIEILRAEVEPEELFVLGFLKGFTRNDLKLMINH